MALKDTSLKDMALKTAERGRPNGLAAEFVSLYGVSASGGRAFDVHSYFARWSLRRRVIALLAAYALALGGLVASWAAGSAAALAAAAPATVICHNDGAGEAAPSQHHDGSHVCVDSCCVGCVLLTAALPPPPVKAIGEPQSSIRLLAPTPALAFPARNSARSHQSRAPPLRA